MNADERRLYLDQITEGVIGCVHRVSNTLGVGFVEKVYENALVIELRDAGFEVVQQHRMEVRYKDSIVGDYGEVLIVENDVNVEINGIKGSHEVYAAE